MPRPGSFAGDLVDLLGNPRFRRLYTTRLLAQSADGITTVALTSYVFFSPERHATAGAAAAAFATTLLPYSLAGPFAGVLLDRWRRQRILVVASLVKALLLLALAALVAADDAGIAFFAVGLAVLSVNRFFLAALSAALPHVVPDGELVMANSVSTTSGTGSSLAGAGAAFALHALLGPGAHAQASVLVASALVSTSAALAAQRIPGDQLGPDTRVPPPPVRSALAVVARGMVDGARHVSACPPAARALAAIAAHRLVYGVWTVATLLVYRNTLHGPADTDGALRGLAQVVAASGVGYVMAAAITPQVTRRVRTSAWIALLLALAALTQAITTTLPVTSLAYVAPALLLGISAQGIKICVDTIVQESVADAYRGRVFSLYDTIFNVTFVAAAVLAAGVVPTSGHSDLLSSALALTYAAAAGAYAVLRQRAPGPAALAA